MSKARRTRARAWRKRHSPMTFINPNKNKNYPTTWEFHALTNPTRTGGGRQKRSGFGFFGGVLAP